MANDPRKNLIRQGRVFVPGQYLGDRAAGTMHRAAGFQDPATLRQQDIKPVGEQLAKEFPWMECIRRDIVKTALPPNEFSAGVTYRMMRGSGELGFYNYSDRPIAIDEIRLIGAPTNTFPHEEGTNFSGIAKNMGCKITNQDVEIFGQWMPVYSIHSVNNRIPQYARHRGAYTLPAKYYLQRGHTFQIRVRTRQNLGDGEGTYTFGLSLHGWDPINKSPIKLVKDVALNRAAGSEVIVTFDEGRDVPLRDALIEHVGIGLAKATDNAANAPAYPFEELMNIELQFTPPEGPKWHTYDDWFPLCTLLNQPGNWFQQAWDDEHIEALAQSLIIHRPITPYILRPKGEIFVDLVSFGLASSCPDETEQYEQYTIYCAMFGRQGSLA